jgi:hypothetical protein
MPVGLSAFFTIITLPIVFSCIILEAARIFWSSLSVGTFQVIKLDTNMDFMGLYATHTNALIFMNIIYIL